MFGAMKGFNFGDLGSATCPGVDLEQTTTPPKKKGKQNCSGFGWMIRESHICNHNMDGVYVDKHLKEHMKKLGVTQWFG